MTETCVSSLDCSDTPDTPQLGVQETDQTPGPAEPGEQEF